MIERQQQKQVEVLFECWAFILQTYDYFSKKLLTKVICDLKITILFYFFLLYLTETEHQNK
jgi:hypothetical protein